MIGYNSVSLPHIALIMEIIISKKKDIKTEYEKLGRRCGNSENDDR